MFIKVNLYKFDRENSLKFTSKKKSAAVDIGGKMYYNIMVDFIE